MQDFTITVVNNTLSNQHISFFQAPATYTVGSNKQLLTAHTNCLYSDLLAPKSLGAALHFKSHLRFYAHVQEHIREKHVDGQISIFEKTTQPIDITDTGDTRSKPAANATTLSLHPYTLSTPIFDPTVAQGAFRITTHDHSMTYSVGLAVFVNAVEIMSNYVNVHSRLKIDCTPALKFYVVTGTHAQGSEIDLTKLPDTYALCDFTHRHRRAAVSLDPVSRGSPESKWNVKMSP